MFVYKYLVTFGEGPKAIKIETNAYGAQDAAVQATIQCAYLLGDDGKMPQISNVEPLTNADELAEKVLGLTMKLLKNPSRGRKHEK